MRPVLGAGAALQRDLVAGSDMAREEVPDGLFLLSCQAWASRISGTRRSTYFLFGAEKRMRRLRFGGLSSRFGSESFECEKFLLLLWESFSCGAVELSAFGFLDFEFEKVSPWLRGCGFMGFVGLSVLVGCGDVFGFPGHVGLTVMVSGSGCQVCV
jgi:hypothetical protein